MSRNRAAHICAFGSFGLCVSIACAGDLTPPTGPVSSTMKTLDDVESRIAINQSNTPGTTLSLFRITAPGSYYLTGNVTGIAGDDGIQIASSDVTIDLNGFTVRGVASSGTGIEIGGLLDNIRIHNGIVRDWGSHGIDLSTGENHAIRDVLTSDNGGTGIWIGGNSSVSECLSYRNGQRGILSQRFNVIVQSCVASLNGFEGIQIFADGSIMASTAYLNGQTGIRVGTGSVIQDCSSSQNGGDGFLTSAATMITNCSAFNNDGDGIRMSIGCQVLACVSEDNKNDGIELRNDCTAIHNVCSGNGWLGSDGAGIHALFGDNRIEANSVINNDRGIDVDDAGNLIVKNSASGNTINYDIVAGNAALVVTVTTSGAISGSSGGISIGTSDPWANISF